MSWTKNNEWLDTEPNFDIQWETLRRFARNFSEYKGRLIAAAILSLVSGVTAFFIPAIFRVVQDALRERDASLLLWALAGFLAVRLITIGAVYLIQRIRSRVSTWLNRELVLRYYGKILNLSVQDFMDFRRRTNLFQRLIDAMSITGSFADVMIRGGQSLIMVLVVGFVVGQVSGTVLGVLAAGAAVLFVYVLRESRKLRLLRTRSLSFNYPLVGKMTEIINGLFTIKALAASVRVTSDVEKLVVRKTEAEFDEYNGELRTFQIADALRTLTMVAAVGMSCALMMRGDLSLADVVALYVLSDLALRPVAEVARLYQNLSRLSVNVGKYYEVLDLQDEAEEAREAAALLRSSNEPPTATDLVLTGVRDASGHVVFRDVTFAYRSGPPVIENLDLEIRPGENVSLIGRSGVGKTTLVRLLLGFLQPQSGRIEVDGIEISSLEDKNAYRRRFGVVSQRDFLFDTSLRENMTFGLARDVEEERIVEAMRLVNLWADVDGLDEGLETQYSGDLFSGGQKQRFFLARALLRDPSIVLLDEPTSALDFESEQRVMEAIDELVGDRTTVTIAHRLSTVRASDRVIVMDDGGVRADGPHDDLYESDAYYRSLCDYNSFVV